jgi:hypothetical protein
VAHKLFVPDARLNIAYRAEEAKEGTQVDTSAKSIQRQIAALALLDPELGEQNKKKGKRGRPPNMPEYYEDGAWTLAKAPKIPIVFWFLYSKLFGSGIQSLIQIGADTSAYARQLAAGSSPQKQDAAQAAAAAAAADPEAAAAPPSPKKRGSAQTVKSTSATSKNVDIFFGHALRIAGMAGVFPDKERLAMANAMKATTIAEDISADVGHAGRIPWDSHQSRIMFPWLCRYTPIDAHCIPIRGERTMEELFGDILRSDTSTPLAEQTISFVQALTYAKDSALKQFHMTTLYMRLCTAMNWPLREGETEEQFAGRERDIHRVIAKLLLKADEVTPEYIRLFCCDILFVMREYCQLVKEGAADSTRRSIALHLERQANQEAGGGASAAAAAAGGSSSGRDFLKMKDPTASWAEPCPAKANEFQRAQEEKLRWESDFSAEYTETEDRDFMIDIARRGSVAAVLEAWSEETHDDFDGKVTLRAPGPDEKKRPKISIDSVRELAHFLREYYEWIPLAGLVFLKAPPHTLRVLDDRA